MHPIFGALSYPMYRPEAEDLYVLLYQVYPDPTEINNKYNRCGPGLPPLNLGQAPDKIWTEALNHLAARALLQVFCTKVQGEQLAPQLKEALDRVFNAEPSVDKNFFSEYVMVLNRVTLRSYLRMLENDASPMKVVLIRGGVKTGKSHCSYLFDHVAKDNGGKSVYIGDGMVGTLNEVIDLLFVALEKQTPVQQGLTTGDAFYRAVCLSLLLKVKEAKCVLWIAVDDLGNGEDGAPRLDPEIRKFFDQFVLQMANPDFRKWFRLMLIHYPEGPVPSKWRSEHWEEIVTQATDIQQGDIEEAIRKWCKMKDLNTPEDEISKKAERILAVSDAPPPAGEPAVPRLRRINDEVNKAIRNLSIPGV